MSTLTHEHAPRAILITPETAYLATRWLHEHPGAVVTLLIGHGGGVFAEQLHKQHPQTTMLAPLETPAAPGAEVVLPLPLDLRPLRHQAPVLMPDVRPHHALINRLWHAGYRRFTWYSLAGERPLALPHQLEAFRGGHQGRRAFVVGNGPSLNQLDMGLLKDEITFGSNRCFLGFPEWGFDFTYWGVYDALQIEEYGSEYEQGLPPGPVKFYPLQYWPLLGLENACPIHMDWPRSGPREFSIDPARLIVGYSVTFMLLQIAALMGCDPIYLIGIDHRYHVSKGLPVTRAVRLAGKWVARHFDHTAWYRAGQGAAEAWQKARGSGEVSRARIWQASDAAGATHFTSKYTNEQKRFLMPRPQDAERDYACALAWAMAQGRTIQNATPNSALEIFPKVNFETLF